MEDRNIREILKIVGQDKYNKVHKLVGFTDNPKDIAEPWYTGNFDIFYSEINQGCNAFIEFCKKLHNEQEENIIYSRS